MWGTSFTEDGGALSSFAIDGTDIREEPFPDGMRAYTDAIQIDDHRFWLVVAQDRADPASQVARYDTTTGAVEEVLDFHSSLEYGIAADGDCVWGPMLRKSEIVRICADGG